MKLHAEISCKQKKAGSTGFERRELLSENILNHLKGEKNCYNKYINKLMSSIFTLIFNWQL